VRKVAEAYLQYLYGKKAQEIEAQNYYRPRDRSILQAHRADFPEIKLYSVDEDFGGWRNAQQTHFSDGGVFDQIYDPGR
jgi:sulfate transport system substrate-binding protein